jgi:hypothetical protein
MVDRFGAVTWWGFSPALDLLDEGKTGVTIVVCSFTCLVGVISLLEKLHLQESGENSHKGNRLAAVSVCVCLFVCLPAFLPARLSTWQCG